MARVLIWDLPTRTFHGLLAGGVAAAAGIAMVLGDDSPLFPYHGLIGLVLAAMIAMRLVWGVAGSRYARFSSFMFGPGKVLEYFKSVFSRGGVRYIGHNPGSAYAIFAMLALLISLAVTGIMLGRGNEGVKQLHELCAYAMVAAVAGHVLGVLLHTVRHRENITASMIHGRKDAADSDAIRSRHVLAAGLFLAITLMWAAWLWSRYDPATGTVNIPLVGWTLQLGEGDEGGRNDGTMHEEDEDDI